MKDIYNRKLYLISGIAILCLAVFASIETIKVLDSKYNGEIIIIKCTSTPNFCFTRNNRIEVEYQNEVHRILIGRKACWDKEYVVGKSYEFMYSKRFNYIITNKRMPEIMIPILFMICMAGMYCFWKMTKSL